MNQLSQQPVSAPAESPIVSALLEYLPTLHKFDVLTFWPISTSQAYAQTEGKDPSKRKGTRNLKLRTSHEADIDLRPDLFEQLMPTGGIEWGLNL